MAIKVSLNLKEFKVGDLILHMTAERQLRVGYILSTPNNNSNQYSGDSYHEIYLIKWIRASGSIGIISYPEINFRNKFSLVNEYIHISKKNIC